MPRARSTTDNWQTAAAQEQSGSGCFSGFLLAPVLVIVISSVLAAFAWKSTPIARAAAAYTATTEVRVTPPIVIMPSPTVPADAPAVAEVQIVAPVEGVATISPPQTVAAWIGSGASSTVSSIFTPEIQSWASSIAVWSRDANVDPNLTATVMQIESCGDPRALSSSGAIGLFQVMPYHFYVTDTPYDPDTNAKRGLGYLVRSLTAANGDARLALAGYNGGIGVIGRYEWTWPDQTQRYVRFGWPIYEDARNGLSSSPALDEWYTHYGRSMCKRAHEHLGLP